MTRDAILDEALRLLARNGIRRFRVSELAEQLGVVKSALYHHFPGGKQQLLQALFEREENRVLRSMEEAAQAAGSCRQRLKRLVQAKLKAISVLRQLYLVPEGVVNEVAEFCRRRQMGFSLRERELLLEVLQEGAARGEVRDVNLPLLAAGLQAALLEVSEHVLRQQGVDVDSLTELMVDVLFSGIGGGPCNEN